MEYHVLHTDFFPLIDIGGSLHHMQADCQHFSGFLPIFSIIAKTGYHSRLIMIVQIQTVPAHSIESGLPFTEHTLQFYEIRLFVCPFGTVITVHIHMLKGEYHIQLLSVKAGVFDGILHRSTGSLTHGDHIIFRQNFPVHLL